MYKIFKYKFNKKTMTAETPEFIQVLRIEHVDDGQYKGDFIWGIVDTNNLETTQVNYGRFTFPYSKRSNLNHLKELSKRVSLKIKEKQLVEVDGLVSRVCEDDGQIFAYYVSNPIQGKLKTEILLFKTGQEIKGDINEMEYLGYSRLHIGQELGLYAFCHK